MSRRKIAVNSSVAAADVVRLSNQCEVLLERLLRGPMTNVEAMVELRILNLTARTSECRQAGWQIEVTSVEGERGVFTYRLVDYQKPVLKPKPLPRQLALPFDVSDVKGF